MNNKVNAKKCKIDIRCTQDEKDTITKTAKEKDIPVADYVRSMIFRNERKKVLRAKDRHIIEDSVELNKLLNGFEDYLFSVLPEEQIYQTGILAELDKVKKGAVNIWGSCLS